MVRSAAAVVALLSLMAARARAGDLREPSPVFGHFALGLGWIEAKDPNLHVNGTAGLLPIELGIGVWLTDRIALAAFGRAGLLHAGGGLELSLLVASERDEEGLALRFSPVLLSDAVTCFDFEEPPCQGALFALFELGPRYRWKLRGLAVSLGISLNAGLLFLRTRQGVPQTTAVFGVMGPKLQIEF